MAVMRRILGRAGNADEKNRQPLPASKNKPVPLVARAVAAPAQVGARIKKVLADRVGVFGDLDQ